MLRRGNASAAKTPVSYTHLDVYKRQVFDLINIDGTVVIGEGELDEAPMLYIGERLGNGHPPKVDVAVDPLEGTNILAKGLPNAIAVVGVAEEGCFLHAPDAVSYTHLDVYKRQVPILVPLLLR